MTGFRGTPGKWEIGSEFDCVDFRVQGEDGEGVCNFDWAYATQNQGRRTANARAIAAVPELIEALEYTLGALNNLVTQLPNDETIADYNLDWADDAATDAERVLKKALGEGENG